MNWKLFARCWVIVGFGLVSSLAMAEPDAIHDMGDFGAITMWYGANRDIQFYMKRISRFWGYDLGDYPLINPGCNNCGDFARKRGERWDVSKPYSWYVDDSEIAIGCYFTPEIQEDTPFDISLSADIWVSFSDKNPENRDETYRVAYERSPIAHLTVLVNVGPQDRRLDCKWNINMTECIGKRIAYRRYQTFSTGITLGELRSEEWKEIKTPQFHIEDPRNGVHYGICFNELPSFMQRETDRDPVDAFAFHSLTSTRTTREEQ